MTESTQTHDVQRRDGQTTTPERTRDRQVYSPRADVVEMSDSIMIIADMPGATENDVDITLEQNVLTLTGKVHSPAREGYQMVYGEYSEGDYERSFALSEGVDREGIEATVSNGVLRLRLPKAKELAARKIPVRSA